MRVPLGHLSVLVLHFICTTRAGDNKPESHPNWSKLDHENCGKSVTSRIVGGEDARLGEFPWMILISQGPENQNLNEHLLLCGGSLLNRYYILTAAHCRDNDIDISMLTAWAGEHIRENDPDCIEELCAPPVQTRKIDEVFLHPKYSKNTVPPKDDIALFKLKEPLEISPFVQPICMPGSSWLGKDVEGLQVTAAGWGYYYQGGNRQLASVLQKVSLPLTRDCKEEFGPDKVCSHGPPGLDTCNGDSGGPLISKLTGDPKYYLLGVVSHGPKECGHFTAPAVYTYVPYYTSFILDKIELA